MPYVPLVGVCFPSVMEKVDELIAQCGILGTDPVDRRCTPVVALPLNVLLERHRPDVAGFPDAGPLYLNPNAPIDDDTTQRMTEAILHAETAIGDVAGSLSSFVNWSLASFGFHPGLEYALPVACRVLGRDADARARIDKYRAYILAQGNSSYVELYDRYVALVEHEFGDAKNGPQPSSS